MCAAKNVQKSVPVKATGVHTGRTAHQVTSRPNPVQVQPSLSTLPVTNEQLIQIELQKLQKEKERLQREQEENNRRVSSRFLPLFMPSDELSGSDTAESRSSLPC
jgi:hypothetical protein